ncbi:MAG: SpaA isopeptide-forming pilin-related protein [Oscillospiraceae bacterium]
MTKTKRIASMAAAALIAVSMTAAATTMTAFAAPGDTTVTVPADSTHTYVAYQIFTGTWETDASGVDRLVGATIGSGVDKAALITAIQDNVKSISSTATDIEIAETLDKATSEKVLKVLKTTGVLTTGTTLNPGDNTLAQGYYYVEETDATGTKGDILYITDGTTITVAPKIGAPTVEKKIKEDDRTISATGETIGSDDPADGWNDAADYCIGEAVPFKLYGTLPANLNMYNAYFYQFIDDLGNGFVTPSADDFKVYLDGTDVTSQAVIDVADPHAITITFNNIMALGATADSIVSVEFSAVLDTDAVVGELGNTNGVKLKYSNNFNYSGSGIGTPDDGDDTNDDDDFDETVDDGVVAFTYGLNVTKYDTGDQSQRDSLAGAKFKLLNADKTQGALIVDDKFAGWTTIENATEFETQANTGYTIVGLDTGTYYLKETKAPAGYNKLNDELELVFTKNDVNGNDTTNIAGDWTYVKDDGTTAYGLLDGTLEGDDDVYGLEGIVYGNVLNTKGPKLPETGGIGTKLFYICGGTLAAGAAILLITKKRADKAE